MQSKLGRAYLVELVGTFGLVYFASAVAILNVLTLPSSTDSLPVGTASLTMHQPGLVGIALAQGLIFALLLSLTLPVSGGFLNPAITLMLWVFNRMESKKAAWLIGAQLLGSVLACLLLTFTFDRSLLRTAHFGTPHVNFLAYQEPLQQQVLYAGTGVELVLTFFLVYAIFAAVKDPVRSAQAAWLGGAVLAAAVLVGFPLTGAALNPARWFGPVLFERALAEGPSVGQGPFSEALIYLAGPILGALLGGLFTFSLYWPARENVAADLDALHRGHEPESGAPKTEVKTRTSGGKNR